MGTIFFWVMTQRVVVISCQCFGTTYRSHLQESRFGPLNIAPTGCVAWPLKMGPIGCPETSVRNYHYSLCNNPEERSSHFIKVFAGPYLAISVAYLHELLLIDRDSLFYIYQLMTTTLWILRCHLGICSKNVSTKDDILLNFCLPWINSF